MNMNRSKIQSIDVDTAKAFWDLLSPENPLFPNESQIIYRGQSDSSWGLIPSIFREGKHPSRLFNLLDRKEKKTNTRFSLQDITSDKIIFTENYLLKQFVDYCDKGGISIPNDSVYLRDILDYNKEEIDQYFSNPSLWPNDKLHELMAFAQHYELPTRLLDWSDRSHIAIYFAASGALAKYNDWKDNNDKRLAVWALNKAKVKELKDIKLVKVPSGVNRNIAAQSGCFSILHQKAERLKPYEGTNNLEEYIAKNHNANEYLKKVTVPMSECTAILKLCELYGVSAATIYPDAYGAAKAAVDNVERYVIRPIKLEKSNT